MPWDKSLWTRLSPLLDQALDLDPALRAAFLADVQAESPALADALERLLDEHRLMEASSFLSTPVVSAREAAGGLTGQAIGAYVLERPLGSGGMGAVWLGRRSDGRFDGAVAVKLLHMGALDAVGLQRFGREGTLLARLSHPHIARLLDAGVTPAGQPFLVLEQSKARASITSRGIAGSASPIGSASSCRSPMPSPTRTPISSCIATSSRRTSWSMRPAT